MQLGITTYGGISWRGFAYYLVHSTIKMTLARKEQTELEIVGIILLLPHVSE